jgi:hypothetical protein
MKMYSFVNSDAFDELIREKCFDESRRKLLDKPAFMVSNAVSGEHVGNLVDISISGIMIVGETAVIEKAEYRLRLEFLHDILFNAVCAWSKDIGAGNYISGLEFSKIDTTDLDSIKDAIVKFTTGEC